MLGDIVLEDGREIGNAAVDELREDLLRGRIVEFFAVVVVVVVLITRNAPGEAGQEKHHEEQHRKIEIPERVNLLSAHFEIDNRRP